MARLTWDANADRLYETGVDHVALFLMKSDGTYDIGKAWNGITGITESPDGADANDIYADNIKYLSLISAENWKGTIKGYTYPNEFNLCQGEYEFNNGGSGDSLVDGVFFGQQPRRRFALAWRTIVGNAAEGDAYGYKLHIAYGLSAAPSEKDHSTVNDSPEATEYSWEINSIPEVPTEEIDGGVPGPVSHVVIESRGNESVYNAIEDLVFGVTEDAQAEIDDADPTLPNIDGLITAIKAAA